ncbi:ribonuclease III [Mycoplasmoides alvi]|uniref:ribonuclease III n=1 Tax=Mycoplasmoides alvi TaxID=78580 RepID=UPI000696CC7F|nr:ribonuclease III [Mycoplasmoides alvi]
MHNNLKKHLNSFNDKKDKFTTNKSKFKNIAEIKLSNKDILNVYNLCKKKYTNENSKKISHELKANLPDWAIVNSLNIKKRKNISNKNNEVYADSERNVSDLLKELKIKPNNINFYIDALTHSSYSNENNLKTNYQRLEFLGDAVLNKLVAIFLFSISDDDEGKMTKDRISIIQAKTLVRASLDLNLGYYVRVGRGLHKRPISEKILEDIFESFIGAVYLDQDEKKVNSILFRTIFKYYLNDDLKETIDYKTKFQEAVQEHGKHKKIIYRQIDKNNKKTTSNLFEVELIYNGIIYGRGTGLKLHDAEVAAAKKACEKISNNSFLKDSE